MSTRKDRSQPNPSTREPLSGQQARVARKNRQLRIFMVGLVVVAAAALAGVFLYQSYLAPYQKTVIKVDNTSVRMGYFLKRLKISGYDASTVIQQLTYEQIVKIEATKIGVKISDAEVDETLRSLAEQASANTTDNTTVPPLSESAFQEWYKKTLKDSGFSNGEYRDMARVNMMANQLQYALAQQVPTSAAQVHLYAIMVNTLAEANAAKARLDSGESFASVASTVSIDSSKDNGGDVGWRPYGTSPYDDTIFALGVGQISSPIPTNSTSLSAGQYLIFMVSEKADNREIDADSRAVLQSRALYDWLQQELSQHTINTYFDAQTQAWVEWQITKK